MEKRNINEIILPGKAEDKACDEPKACVKDEYNQTPVLDWVK